MFALLLLTLVVTGTAASKDLMTRDGRPVRNVAVISRLSDTITLYHTRPSVPVTVWRGYPRSYLVPDFTIDARVEKTIASAIASRFTVVALPSGYADSDFSTWEERSIGGKVRALPQRPDIDAYVVVCQDESSIEMGSFLTSRGLVLYHRWRPIGKDLVGLLGFYRLMIVDARTGEIIAGRHGGIETDIFHPSTARKEIDNSYWPGENALPSGEQIPALREAFYNFMDESLLWTLEDLDVT